MKKTWIPVAGIAVIGIVTIFTYSMLHRNFGEHKSKDLSSDKKQVLLKEDKENKKDKENEEANSSTEEIKYTYPPDTVIENLGSAFSWELKPTENRYDPAYKVFGWTDYGMTKEQSRHEQKLTKEVTAYDKEHPLEEELAGSGKINPSGEFQIGEEIDDRVRQAKIQVNSIEVLDDITTLDEDYFTPNAKEFYLEYSFDKYGNMKDGITIDNNITGTPVKNLKIKFIRINLTIKSYSDWISQDFDITPDLQFCADCKKYLFVTNGYMARRDGGFETYSEFPLYFDLGVYNYSRFVSESAQGDENMILSGLYSYAMRVGEECTFNAVYACPEEFLDNAYFFVGKGVNWGGMNPNTYNNIFSHFIKVVK